MSIKVITLFTLLTLISAIHIPLTPMIPRCTIAFTSDKQTSLKLDIKFPSLEDQNSGLFNTQSKRSTYESIENGNFKKEYDLEENIIYRVCFKMITKRNVGTILIDYSAETEYYTHPSQVKIPDSLLKDSDMKGTYEILEKMTKKIAVYKQSMKSKRETQSEFYQIFIDKNNKIMNISYLEIAAIVILGVYQFFTIRNFLINKQTI